MHFETISELQLETCINGSIYCLMSIPRMRLKAKKMGIRAMLEARLAKTESEHVRTQLHHIFDKMDEPEEHEVINEEDEEDEVDGVAPVGVRESLKVVQRGEEEDEAEEDEDEEDEDEEEDEEDEDEKMSISDFSIDAEYKEF